MKFAVKAWSNGGRARTGVLQLSNCPLSIETPSLLLTTRKGLPVFIAPDLLLSLPSPDSHLLHVSPMHFFEGASRKTISNIGGLHELVGLQNYGFSASPRDSMVCLPVAETTNKFGAAFETPCGRLSVIYPSPSLSIYIHTHIATYLRDSFLSQGYIIFNFFTLLIGISIKFIQLYLSQLCSQIKPSEYVEMVSSLKPNVWASLADEVPAYTSESRNKTSVDRTIRWLDECISLDQARGTSVLGAIVGGSNVDERIRCAQEVAKRNVSGFWIGGFGLGDSMDERPALLNAVVDNLPKEKLRQICGLGLPEEILQGVAAGIDLFDSTYIYQLTLGGFALTFPLNRSERQFSDSYTSDSSGSDNTKINLRATIYRKDISPIVDGCGCYTCKNHTRAYINHLINVHEMLAQILLEIHNTHYYLLNTQFRYEDQSSSGQLFLHIRGHLPSLRYCEHPKSFHIRRNWFFETQSCSSDCGIFFGKFVLLLVWKIPVQRLGVQKM
ncbi:hypothetical protein MKW98_011717, partial [Papaver atlanticum]